ncbi:MAG: hypothetical protein IKD28_04970 [Clostridia bacterium]|nr:hypothetical protein [Clostridia bacterium]
MQLTSPAFLFLFLPLSLAALFLVPQRGRLLTLSLISGLWLLLVNLYNPWGLLQLFLLIALTLAIALPRRKPQWLTVLGVTLPLCGLVAARVLTVLSLSYSYPTGLFFITLSAVSLVLDRSREPNKGRAAEAVCYLLFYPTASLGPVVRYKRFVQLFRRAQPSGELFCEGIRLFMLGFIKRIALAAVFGRTLEDLLNTHGALPLSSLPFFLLISLFYFYFFISGTTDMARGISAMYGLRLPHDRDNLLLTTAPHTMFYGLFLSLRRYAEHYLLRPLKKRLPNTLGKVLACVLLFVCFVLFWGIPPVALPFFLPVLVSMLIAELHAPPRRKPPKPLRALYFFLSALYCSLFALLVSSGTLARTVSLFTAIFSFGDTRFYQFYFLLPDMQYVTAVLLVFSAVLGLNHLFRSLRKRLGERTRLIAWLSITALLFVGFAFSIMFFLPQFPQYATQLPL